MPIMKKTERGKKGKADSGAHDTIRDVYHHHLQDLGKQKDYL